jgi:4,4'-diaponeurosporenoate glycosyltransferase
LRESWQKAFGTGAVATSPVVLGLSVCWLSAAIFAALMLFNIHSPLWPVAAVFYLLNALQVLWYARQLGTFRWLTALLYPIPLVFYFATFAQSTVRRMGGAPITWKGRKL